MSGPHPVGKSPRMCLRDGDSHLDLLSVTQLSIRRCHTNSASGQPSSSITCSLSSRRSIAAAEDAPSLLGSILRRLEASSAARQANSVSGDKDASTPPAHLISLPSPEAVEEPASEAQGRRDARTSAYVPLLFRPEYIRAAALRRHQQSVPLHMPTLGVSSAPAALSRPEQASLARSSSAAVAHHLHAPLPPSASAAINDWMSETASESPSKSNSATASTALSEGGRHQCAAATETPEDTLQAAVATKKKGGNANGFSTSDFPEHETRNSEADVGLAVMGEDDAVAAAVGIPIYTERDKQDALDELHADYEHAEEADNDVSDTHGSRPAQPAAPRQPRCGNLVLDPIEWLSQSADAPLMSTEMLYSNTSVKDQLSETVEATGAAYTAAASHNLAGADAHREGVSLCSSTAAAAPSAEEQTRDSEEKEAELLADLLSDVPQQRRKRKEKPLTLTSSTSAYSSHRQADPAESAPTPSPPSQPSFGKPAVEPDALVYNIFTRRIAKASSSTIRTLSIMGIGVHPETRELTVTDAEALQRLASELRAHRVSWPRLWSRGGLYRQLERLLSDDTVTDTAVRVAGLLRMQYNKSHLQRQRPGLVVGNGSPTSGGASSSSEDAAGAVRSPYAAPPMAESVDDKLLTLQDLNEEQQAVVELITKGHHTYIGGGAGTGKSVLLRVIKHQLMREGLAVAVTGTTGIAATQIGGCTLHHCLGINVSGEFTRRSDLSSYDVIIIDEVSMLSLELFESLEVQLRRANNAHLPFGGVQMILCGDFLQLGAIDSRPLIMSPLFRRNFVHLKLQTVVRQNQNIRFAAQLQQLRRGRVPVDLGETVRFVTPQQIEAVQQAEMELKQRQQEQLAALVPGGGDARGSATNLVSAPNMSDEQEARQAEGDRKDGDARSTARDRAVGETVSARAAPATPFVNGAVNLLPTNAEVQLTNAQQLQQLPGEIVSYAPQFLPPCLVGNWSPTFILRVYEPDKLRIKVLRMEIQHYLCSFYSHGQRASPGSQPSTAAPAVSFSYGEWLLNPHLGERSIVLYSIFVDALVFRVRMPFTIDREEARQFLLHVADLDCHLETLNLGVRVRDVLTHGEGMHTEQDEYILSQYAARAPLAHSLTLKIGARVMLRANFGPGLVNGSLGTVVGFRKLMLAELPRYLVGTAQREEAVVLYSDFLQYEQGFQVPMVPVVDFNGRQVPIPPMTQYVGGLPNTHHYCMGIVALPLSLAYAFTVHKVQGLTLVGRVHLELSRMWPCEHLLYVALSRVRDPDQLSVSAFHSSLVRAAADCLLFDDSLPSVWEAKIAPYMLAATWKRSPSRRKKVLLQKKMEVYAKQRRKKFVDEAQRGDMQAQIRLLEETMLKQRAKAVAKAKRSA
ncbi:putative DNA repair and recombination helicase protein PIF2 [Leptomonas seymouri]|uniref:ATP-dependent DNA helicase n=1 Tax=Leptomonas seymouri TaxID=5684 RepID=A0A0N1IIS5_LEPSE|nr:putative DNA repair and recombination helicase protein PIF2 [Leptomonas seymouri]|eukprot:KPI84400.1 putative DNA repair and recombination helicase protein PIF2 [Leptomonas seymouri]